MTPEPIRILVTGGTFDKEYNELTGTLFFHDTHVPEMLPAGALPVGRRGAHADDDRQPGDDRRRPRASSRSTAGVRRNRRIVDHARHRHDGRDGAAIWRREMQGKTIVLTGAMVPYKFGSSDGLFNLGSALAFVQTLPAGVYIAMNGRVFPWDRARKNRTQGIFESV